MSQNFIVVKHTKSVGIAILLTLLFGPLGLFYASVFGGIIMCILPIVLFVILWVSLGTVGAESLAFTSLSALLIYAALGWLICIIWAAIAINRYNNKIMKKSSHFQSNNQPNYIINSPSVPNNNLTSAKDSPKENIQKPTYGEWKAKNPYRTLNDYYRIYGNPLNDSK